jgi:spectinomycin phosphotransferase
VRGPFEHASDADIAAFVASRWALDIVAIEYVAEGGGAYHWLARAADRRTCFVTVDDLTTKPWLGSSPEEVFAGLTNTYATAVALRADGLAFVAAPEASAAGAVAERFDARHSVAVFAYIDGVPGQWGLPAPGDVPDVVEMLAALHASRPTAALARRGLDVPGRAALEHALANLDDPWSAGPYGERARTELATHAAWVVEMLDRLDGLAARLSPGDVVTHGEPHPGNLIRTTNGLMLLDWDTVALARPERDLWMVAHGDATDAAPRLDVDPDAVEAYRLLWALADVASFVRQLRGPHTDTVDSARALVALQRIFQGSEPAPYGRA